MKKALLLLLLVLCIGVIWELQSPGTVGKYLPVSPVQEFFANLFGEKEKLEPLVPKSPPLPENSYVLRERIIFPLTQGGGAWETGTLVKKVGEGSGKLVVSDGTRKMIVDEAKLTRDPSEILAIKSAAEAQAGVLAARTKDQIRRSLAEVERKLADTKTELAITVDREQEARQLGKTAGMTTSSDFLQGTVNRLEAQKKELQKKLAAP